MTDQPKPTPGPWKTEFYRVPIGDTGDYDDVVHICGQDGRLVAFVEDCNAQEANAALIARAPELQQRVDILTDDNQRLRELLRECHEIGMRVCIRPRRST